MPNGLDLVAAYPDHSARYHNFSGKGIIWDHPNDSLNDRIDALMAAASRVVARIVPWDKPRPSAPPRGYARLCFLTPSGVHFGQAPTEVIEKDPVGREVFSLASGLMMALVNRAMARAA